MDDQLAERFCWQRIYPRFRRTRGWRIAQHQTGWVGVSTAYVDGGSSAAPTAEARRSTASSSPGHAVRAIAVMCRTAADGGHVQVLGELVGQGACSIC